MLEDYYHRTLSPVIPALQFQSPDLVVRRPAFLNPVATTSDIMQDLLPVSSRRFIALVLLALGVVVPHLFAATGDSLASAPVPAEIALTVLGPTVKLAAAHTGPLTWSTSDPSVVTVTGGWVFGKREGNATVKALHQGGPVAEFVVKVAPGVALAPAPKQRTRIESFITRSGNQLFEDGKPFRFISWNVPNLHVLEDPSWKHVPSASADRRPVFWHRVTEAEQEDAVKTVVDMGGQVIRGYTLSVVGGRNNRTGPSHYTGPKIPLNEDLMQDYDRMVAVCSKHGVRLMLPIIDEWYWFGGRKEFTELSGGGDFYTTRRVIDDYKAVIKELLTRVNTVTGIAYKDDPTIMAWETGNELQKVPPAWTSEIAAFIKSLAPRQLVIDGANGSIESVDDPNIDMVTNHYYDQGGKDYIARTVRDQERMGAKKPFFVGEFGCTDPDMELGALDAALHNGAAGALFWSLRFRSSDGGFYWHNEGGSNSAYHWPGFASNARSDEIRVLREMREKAWAIRGFLTPPRSLPEAPTILSSTTPAAFVWMGSVGAEHYVLERSLDGKTWTPVASDLSDAGEPFVPFVDRGAPAGASVSYRLKAVNIAGESLWSEVHTCPTPNTK